MFPDTSKKDIINIIKLLKKGVDPKDITEATIQSYLEVHEDIDMQLHTANHLEDRVTIPPNMLWQTAYTEFVTTPTPFNMLTQNDIQEAVIEFYGREESLVNLRINR